MSKITDEEITKMQERISWLEINLEEANQLIYDLLDRLNKTELQIKYLASMQEDPSAVRPLSEETPPPHY